MQSFFFCCCLFLSKINRSGGQQVDSKEGYLTLWCHQSYPSQSLNLQTVVESEGQEEESDLIFQKVLGFVVKKTTAVSRFCTTKV